MLTAVIYTDTNGLLTTASVPAYKSRWFQRYVRDLTKGSKYGSETKIILTDAEIEGLTSRYIFNPVKGTFNGVETANTLSNFLKNNLYALFCTSEYYNEILPSCNKVIICYTNQETKGPGESPEYINLELLHKNFTVEQTEDLSFGTKVTYVPVAVKGQLKYFIGEDTLKTVYTNKSCIPGFELDAADNTVYYSSRDLFKSENEAIEYLETKFKHKKEALARESEIILEKLSNLKKYTQFKGNK